MYKGLRFAGLAILLTILLGSCNRHSQLLYMQGNGTSKTFKPEQKEYRITSKDELYIQISSMLNKEINALFTNNISSQGSYNSMVSEVGVYVNTYSVSDSGYIEVPLIGKVKVVGKTIDQVSSDIRKITAEYVNDAIVVVKLMSFRVTIIGEVKRPTVITNYHDKMTILEAIAQAGDMTDYANRKVVTLIRNIDGENVSYKIDLTSKDILSNPGYYLTPGDVIVVDPRKGKITQMNIPTYSIFLTTISTFILLLNFIK